MRSTKIKKNKRGQI